MSDNVKLSHALNGIDYDIKEWLMKEYAEEMKHLHYLKHLDVDGLGCGDQDAHGDRIDASAERLQAIQIRHDQL